LICRSPYKGRSGQASYPDGELKATNFIDKLARDGEEIGEKFNIQVNSLAPVYKSEFIVRARRGA